jgi:hypothetical protein
MGAFLIGADHTRLTMWFRKKSTTLRAGYLMESTYDWLPERIARMERVGHELDLKLTWSANPAATQQELRDCEAALTRINVPFGPTHRAFLRRYNGATHTYNRVDADAPDDPYGATYTIFSCARIADAVDKCYFRDEITELFPRIFWEPTIPIVDLDGGGHLASDPRVITYGEPAIVWSHNELGATYGDGITYVAHSFEALLIRMFDRIGLKRATPDFWQDPYQKLRFDWIAPDNRHRTNFPLSTNSS